MGLVSASGLCTKGLGPGVGLVSASGLCTKGLGPGVGLVSASEVSEHDGVGGSGISIRRRRMPSPGLSWFLAHLSRRLTGEHIGYPWIRRPSIHRLRPSFHIFKHLLLRNRLANQSQILCGAFLGRGNESLYKWSRSHDQDSRHAHILQEPFENLLLQNRRADFHETWYVASGTPAHRS